MRKVSIAAILNKLELTDGKYLLNAGAALFCDCGIINEVQIAKFASNERLTFTDMRRYSGSIMELKKKTEQYLIDAMDWRVAFGNLTRKEIPEVPLDAIREAVTNSFGHKMYDSAQSNEIAIFKNRIEIYNPGAFPAHCSYALLFKGYGKFCNGLEADQGCLRSCRLSGGI